MYEGFYEKSSGYAMAAGMLLSTMSLLHANDNPVQADEGAKGTTLEQEHTGYSIKADEDMSARRPSGWKMIKGL